MFRLHPFRGISVFALLLCLVGCEASKSANPVAPSSIGAEVVAASDPAPVVTPARIDAPVAMAPAGRLNHTNPDFLVMNGAIAGTNSVAYRFEISKTADFSQMAAVVTVPVNDAGQTFMSLGALAYGGTFYWRAKGSDGTAESDYSNTLAFTLPNGPNVAASSDPVASIDSAAWSNERWRDYFFSLVEQTGGATVSDAGMHAMREALLAHGADFQNGWRGDVRPRLFLPVSGCPIANRPDVPVCSYNRTVDLGSYGQEWRWIVR